MSDYSRHALGGAVGVRSQHNERLLLYPANQADFLSVTMKICTSCLQRLQTPADVGGDGVWSCEWRVDRIFLDLVAVSSNCFFCHAILQRLPINSLSDRTPLSLRHVFRQRHAGARIADLKITISAGNNQAWSREFLVADVEDKDVSLSPLHGTSTGCDDALDFLRGRYRQCMADHQICRRLTETSKYPTRLIQLLYDGAARLVITELTPPSGPYATLSHCWGREEMFQSTTETMNDLTKNIPMRKLRPTFIEAFRVARHIGIQYLWIDSLCIIQDSVEDWAREVQLMKDVYRRASINLAATTSRGATTGMFHDREPNSLVSDDFCLDNGVAKGNFKATGATLHSDDWQSIVELGSLNQRAWVTQERVLSTRTAHFTPSEIIWDCPESIASELITKSKHLSENTALQNRRIGQKKNATILNLPNDSPTVVIDQWTNIVNEYTSGSLTKKTDKLIAIRGIAELLRDLIGADYHCGLWQLEMELQLCWHRAEPLGKTINSDLDIAPSWSWASFAGPVEANSLHRYDGYRMSYYATIVAASTRCQPLSNGREQWSGTIRVQCVLHPVTLEGTIAQPRLSSLGVTTHFHSVDLDNADTFDKREGLYVVPIYDSQDPYIFKAGIYNLQVRGLLLQVVDAGRGVYTRRGHIFLSTTSDRQTGEQPLSWKQIVSALGKAHLPCVSFDEHSGHLIDII